MSSNSAHSSSQRDVFDSFGASDAKKMYETNESQKKSFAESPKHMGLNLLDKDTLMDIQEYETKEKLLVMARKAVEEKNQFSIKVEKMKDKQQKKNNQLMQSMDQVKILENKLDQLKMEFD